MKYLEVSSNLWFGDTGNLWGLSNRGFRSESLELFLPPVVNTAGCHRENSTENQELRKSGDLFKGLGFLGLSQREEGHESGGTNGRRPNHFTSL